MKYINADKLKEEIDKRYQEYKTKSKGDKYYEGMADSLDYFEQFLDSLEPFISSNLDEAAEDFVWEVMENDEDGISELSRKLYPSSKINDYYDGLAEFFKAGAEWMIERVISWLKENGHIYLYDAEVNRGEDYKVDLRISEKCFEDLRKAIK